MFAALKTEAIAALQEVHAGVSDPADSSIYEEGVPAKRQNLSLPTQLRSGAKTQPMYTFFCYLSVAYSLIYLTLIPSICSLIFRPVDMKNRSEVWAAVDSRLEELLVQLRDHTVNQCVNVLQGLAVIFHLAALCSRHCLNAPQR